MWIPHLICSYDSPSKCNNFLRSDHVAAWLALLTAGHEVLCLNPARGRIQLMLVLHFIAQSRSLEPLKHLQTTYDLNTVEKDVKYQGLVVQSIVSLISSLVVKISTVLVSTISDSQVFLLKKM